MWHIFQHNAAILMRTWELCNR